MRVLPSAPNRVKICELYQKHKRETKHISAKISINILVTVIFALCKSRWPMNFEIDAEAPIAIPMLKLMIVNKTGKANDMAERGKTPNLPI